jgi:hypothetical protein
MTTSKLDALAPTGSATPNAPPTDPTAMRDARAAEASIYRRLERRQRGSQGLTTVLFVLIAAILTAGVVAIENANGPAPGPSAAADAQQ